MSAKDFTRWRRLIWAGVALAVIAAVVMTIRPASEESSPPAEARESAAVSAEGASESVGVASELPGDVMNEDLMTDLAAQPRVKKPTDSPLSRPVHEVRASLAETIAAETIRETAENLANDDDMHFALASLGSISSGSLSTQGQILITTRLVRTRKLIQEGRESPERVVPVLRRLLKEGLDWWEADKEAYFKRVSDTCVFDAKDPAGRARRHVVAATYILAELDDYDALPLLMRTYKQHEVDSKGRGLSAAAPPGMTLVAMRRLVTSYPEGGLSPEARSLLEDCRRAVVVIPGASAVTVTSWQAHYGEADPTVVVFEEDRKMLGSQPKMTMNIWPHRYIDGKDFNIEDGAVPERTKTLFAKLEKFVRAAYPDAEF